jgi:hypothetical protein
VESATGLASADVSVRSISPDVALSFFRLVQAVKKRREIVAKNRRLFFIIWEVLWRMYDFRSTK